MSTETKARVLVVGAGSMGLVLGYIFNLAAADVTFLVRPHRAKDLSRPQKLYCYDDNQLKTFKEYEYLTLPADAVDTEYDFIVITLDGDQLMGSEGQKLTKTIGKAALGKKTKVIVGTVQSGIRDWFLQQSGLPEEQVAGGNLAIHAYSPKAVELPLQGNTDPKLLAEADQAYTDVLFSGMVVDDSSPAAAEGFAKLYNASGVSKCVIMPAVEMALFAASTFPLLAAWDIMGWSSFLDPSKMGETWSLGVAASKEISRLDMFGAAGQEAAKTSSDEAKWEQFAGMEKAMFPMNWPAFNRYHHGGKVTRQDRTLLRIFLSRGQDEGKKMPALEKLIQQVEQRPVEA